MLILLALPHYPAHHLTFCLQPVPSVQCDELSWPSVQCAVPETQQLTSYHGVWSRAGLSLTVDVPPLLPPESAFY